MDRVNVIEKIEETGIIPVVVLDSAADALPLAKALTDGGLPCAEITFRTDAAEESIRLMHESFPKMLIGAGTVLTTEQVDRAMKAGASFIVSPGTNPRVVRHCLDKGIPIIPGVCTPTEVEAALELGLEVLKFFPAEPAGGLKMIKAMAAPYTSVRFMPTGGIGPENAGDYLAYSRVVACGGSWMVKGELIRSGNFDEIRRLTAEAAALVKKYR